MEHRDPIGGAIHTIMICPTSHSNPSPSLSLAAATTLPSLARFAFAAVFLTFFWNSAATKLDGLFTPTLDVYAQVFPKAMEAVGCDVSQLSAFHTLVVLVRAWAEYALPAVARHGFLQCVTRKVAAEAFLCLGGFARVSGLFNAPFNPT